MTPNNINIFRRKTRLPSSVSSKRNEVIEYQSCGEWKDIPRIGSGGPAGTLDQVVTDLSRGWCFDSKDDGRRAALSARAEADMFDDDRMMWCFPYEAWRWFTFASGVKVWCWWLEVIESWLRWSKTVSQSIYTVVQYSTVQYIYIMSSSSPLKTCQDGMWHIYPTLSCPHPFTYFRPCREMSGFLTLPLIYNTNIWLANRSLPVYSLQGVWSCRFSVILRYKNLFKVPRTTITRSPKQAGWWLSCWQKTMLWTRWSMMDYPVVQSAKPRLPGSPLLCSPARRSAISNHALITND